MKSKLIIFLAIIIAGCVIPKSVPMRTVYNQNDYSKYRKIGNNSIAGQAFLKKKNGDVVTCAGNPVKLSPDEPYYREYWEIVRAKNKPIESQSPDQLPSSKKTICDALGNFIFNDLPDGNWLLATYVTWNITRNFTEGGVLLTNVKLKDGKQEKIILSGESLLK